MPFITDTEALFQPQKKVSVAEFEEVFAQRPQVIVCNVEFLSFLKKVAKGFVVIPKLLGLLF